MLTYYNTVDRRLMPISAPCDGCWVRAMNPTEEEIDYLVRRLGAQPEFVRAAMDDEETSRVEQEDDQTLLIVDAPVAQRQNADTLLYTTMPIGIIIMKSCIITVSLQENSVLSEIAGGQVRNIQTNLKTRFLLMILFRIAVRFLQYLKQIDRISSLTEKQLRKMMKNKELIQLLGLEKSLVYFSTSLKANEVTLEKIHRGRIIKLYEEDQDLLEDVLIEVKQAIEMCSIYTSILSSTMDAFASIISNNLNIVMKVLTSLTVVMAIPTMISSFYGMNVSGLPLPYFWFPLALSAVATIIVSIILVKKKMFS